MQTINSLENRVGTLEKNLTSEQVAEMGRGIIDRFFDKEISEEEVEKQIKEFVDRYVNPMDHNTWVKYILKKNELEEDRWAYTYFKEVVVSLDFKIAFFQQCLALICALQSHEDYITSLHGSIPGFKEAWVKHCKEHPEDKRTEVNLKRRLKEFYESEDPGDFLDTISNLEKERADILNWEGWDKIGYPKPVSVFAETEESE